MALRPLGDPTQHPPSTADDRLRVVVADGNHAYREGVKASLDFTFLVEGEAACVDELEDVLARTQVDLLLVDHLLPGGGLDAAVETVPQTTKVVVFAERPSDNDVVHALRLGVDGFLLKDISSRRLSTTLRAVVSGEPVLNRSLVGALVNEISGRGGGQRVSASHGDSVRLTPREYQIALYLSSGRTTHEIATALGISRVTVRRHISEVMRKLEVGSRADAVELLAG